MNGKSEPPHQRFKERQALKDTTDEVEGPTALAQLVMHCCILRENSTARPLVAPGRSTLIRELDHAVRELNKCTPTGIA
jgi:hypothetical protein